MDTVIANTNLYAKRKTLSKGKLESSSQFCKCQPTNREELLAFFRLTMNLGLINKIT